MDRGNFVKQVISEEFGMTERVKIDAYQSGGLVIHTRRLAELAQELSREPVVTSLTTGVILMASAALEALLSEAAYLVKPSLYECDKFRFAGAPRKFKMLMGYCSDDVEEIWELRKAVAHAEPDNPRTRHIGSLDALRALWAAGTIDRLAIEVWGDSMPWWFSETTGLSPGG